ncbi:imidazole glycerol phosphate synthase subunit HisH [Fuscovulum ytuae]|uniref:Imidazole glycerol phosphate synthase subunit HisH n=1 Tax=Fuscovulum ytuae TaxID=3042299 RepID=A0ABY8Q3M4_9RHOB|nr:imidazole glycerol phosphate synthase subunit HisH [Fuscovulum sp. YMD61]WGV15421.1 imidazole glycerol phosphate synthase subunit HisH [Fuscovulum sp. YMD61]
MASKSCVIIDYGIGNVFSVSQALAHLDASVTLTSDPAAIRAADRVILPGVGAFGRAVDTLRAIHMDEVIFDFINTGRPFLGICVGMQVMMEHGLEFGTHQGLGLFKGTVEQIDLKDSDNKPLRVPLIGWNSVRQTAPGRWQDTPFATVSEGSDFYFVHSYAAKVTDPLDVAAIAHAGAGVITAAVQRDNITGVQFHPERSADAGRAFLSGFLAQ